MAKQTKPIRITRARTLKAGLHEIAGTKGRSAIVIEGKDFEVDLTGVHLRGGTGCPWTFEGTGILLRNCRNVTLRGARVSGYWHGIEIRNCHGVTLVECDASGCYDHKLKSTPDKYDPGDWLNIFKRHIWETYGFGFYVVKSKDCRLRRCTSKRGLHGVGLIESNDCTVEDGDLSRNSGWGIWLYDASDNRIIGNNTDWCVRCESESYSAGGDTAGIMVCHNCCRNVIAHNSMRFGGDGFFLNGLWVDESTDNLIAFNDASHSPHNAFESSWSGRNTFVGNIASNSRYGMWLGLSYENRVLGNVIDNNLFDGIAIEHAHHNVIAGNLVRGCRSGIRLLNRDPKKKPSHHYTIHGNTIERCRRAAVLLERTLDTQITGNRIGRSALAFRFEQGCERIDVAGNTVLGVEKKLAELGDSKGVRMNDNYWDFERIKSVLSRISINKRSALTLERIAAKKFAAPRRPVAVGYASKKAARDRSFRWYAELEHLVGL